MTSTQTWHSGNYHKHAAFVPELGKGLLDLLTIDRSARVLDLGCGDGVLTEQLVQRGYDVLGVDASEAMVRAARARGLNAQVLDGHALSFDNEFDAVFSNAALHWLTRPDEAIAGAHRALRRGGQFVAELGGAGNVASVVGALVAGLDARGVRGQDAMPWYFPSVGDYATRLERAGFRVDFISHFDRPTPLPTDVLDWIATFGESFTRSLPAHERPGYLAEVRERLARSQRDALGNWTLDYVRLRFRAHKP
jgi:trans-aconitate methyltransferase